MKQKDAVVLAVLQQVQAFLNDNAGLLQSVNSTDTRKALDDVITQLGTSRVAQSTSARLGIGATAAQESAKRVLLEQHMRAIVGVAKAQLPALPELSSLAMAATGRVTNQELLEAAESMVEVTAAHDAVFAGALGPDYHDELVAAMNDVISAASQGASHRAQQRAATSGIVTQVSRGRKILRVLDPLVKKTLAGNTQLLADWQNRLKIAGPARAVGTTAGMPVVATTAPQPTPAPSTATPAQPAASPASSAQ